MSAYGRRQLLKQGWKPGQTLGLSDAPQARHLSAASVSHIRIAPLEENRGLGAGRDDDETTGLDGLQDLLGRLNGNDEAELLKEKEKRDATRRRGLLQQRYGRVWVSGGYLAHDSLEDKALAAANDARPEKSTSNQGKASVMAVALAQDSFKASKGARKNLKSRKGPTKREIPRCRQRELNPEGGMNVVSATEAIGRVADVEADEPLDLVSPADSPSSMHREERSRRKKQRKASTRSNHEEPDVAQNRGRAATASRPPSIQDTVIRADAGSTVDNAIVESASANALWAGGRSGIRRRHVKQKKMALDIKSLNEVSLVYAGSRMHSVAHIAIQILMIKA